jgi:hypothetical protein
MFRADSLRCSLGWSSLRAVLDQSLNITYGDAPFLSKPEELVAAAEKTSDPALQLFLEDMEESSDALASFVFGDFNEPSFRDWNDEAVKAGLQPLVVRYPTTFALDMSTRCVPYTPTWWPNQPLRGLPLPTRQIQRIITIELIPFSPNPTTSFGRGHCGRKGIRSRHCRSTLAFGPSFCCIRGADQVLVLELPKDV